VELQLKLVDPSGTNVWWWRQPGFVAPRQTHTITLRKARLEFAWGPASGGEPGQVGAVEIALASNTDVAGTYWLEDVRLEPRDPAAAHPRIVAIQASSTAGGHDAARILDTRPDATWRPTAGDAAPWFQLDFGQICELGGVIVDFAGTAPASRLLLSDDGQAWTALVDAPAGAPRHWLRAEGEGRFARVEFTPVTAPPTVVHVAIAPLELAVSRARYAATTARQFPRGRFPRHLLGEQGYWAVVGADGDEHKGLLGEDGALEVGAESFSIEPWLWVDERLVTWADVEVRTSLADGYLPVPSVEWEVAGIQLAVTAFAHGEPGRSALVVRYVLTNHDTALKTVRLFLAIRPFQVNPAWQSLNLVGGVAPVERLERMGSRVLVNGTQQVVAVTPLDGFGAADSNEGLDALTRGQFPLSQSVDDPIGFAEGALAFDLTLAPGAEEGVVVAVPLYAATPAPPADLDRTAALAWGNAQLGETLSHWRARFAVVPIELPHTADAFATSLRASIGWILVNREGPRIQPGPRTYRRSWIRDGTLTGTALAELGFLDEPRAFLRWYAPYQYEDGRVPCAVDRRGVDPVAEHDSHGQLVWGVVETFRLTRDRAFLGELWPHVLRAVDAIAALRAQRTGDALRGDARFGLLPESISHEGYSSHPVHAYWDDFFAVRGLADAADAANVLGDTAAAERISALRDAMRADLHASIRRTMADHSIDFIPGSVELGDFDPTSTAIALDPCGEQVRLPPAALARTFDRYWAEFEGRRSGQTPADAYTPYEVRTAAALIMLGQKQRALELLAWLIADQRLTTWRQWPEIAWRDRRAPRFLGDLPHGWVASSFVRAVRRLIAYERDEDGALVIAAGVPAEWVRAEPGVRVRQLPTHAGPLDYTMCADGDDRVRVTLGGLPACPPGGIIVMSPLESPLRTVHIDGRAQAAADPDRVHIHTLVAKLLLEY